jgi:hypothetical protein
MDCHIPRWGIRNDGCVYRAPTGCLKHILSLEAQGLWKRGNPGKIKSGHFAAGLLHCATILGAPFAIVRVCVA